MWNFCGERKSKSKHPAAFSVELPYRCIKLFSYVGDLILDPFIGSGSTLIAAKNVGRNKEEIKGNIIISTGNEQENISIPISVFQKQAEFLLEKIKSSKGSSFFVEEIEGFLKEIKCATLKASSKDKIDIRMIVHDLNTGMNPKLGFSIKSMLGGASTLLNASNATNFIYEIRSNSLDSNKIDEVNAINSSRKVRDRLEFLIGLGAEIVYCDLENATFKANLQMIDSNLPMMLADMIKSYYLGIAVNTVDLLNNLNNNNPCDFLPVNYVIFSVAKKLSA